MPPAASPAIEPLPVVDVPNVEICRTGRWNGHDYTPADLQSVLDNFNALKGVWSVPLTLGHDGESLLGDGAPALGWVQNVRLENGSLRADYTKVPAKVAQLLQSGAYAKRSCTFLVDPEIDGQVRRGLVLQNVALLGAQTPAVDGLEDIFALYNRRRLAHSGRTAVVFQLAGNEQALLDYWLPKVGTPGWWDDCVDAVSDKVDDPQAVCGWIKAQANSRENSRLRGVDMDLSQRLLQRLLARGRLQLASGPSYDSQRAAVQAALNAQYQPCAPMGDDDETAGGGATEPSSTIVMLFPDSVVVDDNDGDAYFEIPYTMSGATATLGAPVQVELRPTPIDGGTSATATASGDTSDGTEGTDGTDGGSGDGADGGSGGAAAASDAGGSGGSESAQQMARALVAIGELHRLSRASGLDAELEQLLVPVEARIVQLAAAPVDSDVERLVQEMQGDLDQWLSKLNSIASGKAGVTQMRTLLGMLKSGLAKFKVGESGSAGNGGPASPSPSKPAAPAKTKSSRQEDIEVKLSQLARIYGLPETATEDEVLRVAQGAAASRDVVHTLARKVDQLLERDAEKETEAMLDRAVAEGRLKRYAKPGEDSEMYTTLRKLARSDLATARSIVASLPRFVDTNEYGAAGDQGEPPGLTITPGVARELRKLGRDPETLSKESLEARWKRERHEAQVARARKLGIPARA